MFPIFQDQGLSRVCEVGIELPNLEPLKISGEILAYNINPKAQENDHSSAPGRWRWSHRILPAGRPFDVVSQGKKGGVGFML